jgi:DNA gyrase/topoisomerase IV subunit B
MSALNELLDFYKFLEEHKQPGGHEDQFREVLLKLLKEYLESKNQLPKDK